MYRTVKTADRAAAFSGQSDVHENASSVDATEDIIFYLQNPRRSGDQLLSAQTIHVQDNKDSWENSSSTGETSLHAIGANIQSLDDQEAEGNIGQWEQQRLQQAGARATEGAATAEAGAGVEATEVGVRAVAAAAAAKAGAGAAAAAAAVAVEEAGAGATAAAEVAARAATAAEAEMKSSYY
ncbi:PREDICTED: probable transcription factor KAN2 [Prunus mume]|uniref:Probable transcription factor KAN2 n=1 Tax=Prunus mume TaxID=102107 RepID=A0ABM0NER2_PRUMU|nr:PREDICTED: probable transcription factor KAN2 [Prunus mume]